MLYIVHTNVISDITLIIGIFKVKFRNVFISTFSCVMIGNYGE